MPTPIEHHVYFAVVGFDASPREISLLVGVEPDDVWIRGEPFTDTNPEALRRESRWIISSGLDQQASHRDHFERLLFKLERIAPQLPELQRRFRCGIGVSRFFFMEDPDFYLPPGLRARFQSMGLDIGFDQLLAGETEADFPDLLPEILALPDDQERD